MELSTREILKKKILDSQEMVKDFEVYSKQVKDEEVSKAFKDFALESGQQARKMQDILKKLN